MNIALIVRKYQTSGGTERYNYNISKCLSEKGHKVTIFCNKAKLTPPNQNIKIIKLPNLPLNRQIKTFLFNYFVDKKINLNNFDIVQGCGKILKQDIYRAGGGFHKLYLRAGNVNRFTKYDKMVMNIEQRIYNVENTKYVIAVSRFIANEIHNEFNYPMEKIKIFHNPVDLKTFNNKNKAKDKKYILEKLKIDFKNRIFLFVANNFKLKGLIPILEAFKTLKNYKILIVGNDNFKEIIENYNNNITDNTIFLHERKGNELIKIYHAADVLLHPTYFDPFANVSLEAMASGIPVVTTKINGASEILDNGIDGVVIEHADDIVSLRQVAEKLITDKNFLKTLTDNSSKKILNYSIEKYIDRLTDFYKKVYKEKFNV